MWSTGLAYVAFYVLKYFFFCTQQIEFLTYRDVTFCQILFLSILNNHLIMLIECIKCWKSLHLASISDRMAKGFSNVLPSLVPSHFFNFLSHLFWKGGLYVSWSACGGQRPDWRSGFFPTYSMASGDQTQSSGMAMIPYLLSLLTGLVCTYLVNGFFCIHVNQVCSLWLFPLSFFLLLCFYLVLQTGIMLALWNDFGRIFSFSAFGSSLKSFISLPIFKRI